MAKAKKRKNTIISETAIKSINFFGQPNVDKRSIFLRAQKLYADAMNNLKFPTTCCFYIRQVEQ